MSIVSLGCGRCCCCCLVFCIIVIILSHLPHIRVNDKTVCCFSYVNSQKKTNTEELWPHEQKKIDIIFYPWWHGWIELRWTFVLFPNINMYINWTHNDNFAWTLDIRHHTLDYVQCKRNIGSYIVYIIWLMQCQNQIHVTCFRAFFPFPII